MSEKVVSEEELIATLLYNAAKCIHSHISRSELATALFISNLSSYFKLNVAIDAVDDKDPTGNSLNIEIIKKFLILLKNETDFEKKASEFIEALHKVNEFFSTQPIMTFFNYKSSKNTENTKIKNELEKLIEKIESRYRPIEIKIVFFEFSEHLRKKGFKDLSFINLPQNVGLLESLSKFLEKLSELYHSNSVNSDDLNFLVLKLKNQNHTTEEVVFQNLLEQITAK